MPRLRSLVILVLACVVAFVPGDAAARDPGSAAPGPESERRFHAALDAFGEADSALAEQRWDDAIAAYGGALEALGDDAVLGGLRDNAHYNTACAHARAGRNDAAAAAFAQSVEHGIRLLASPTARGWTARSGLTIAHLLHDPDLDPIREHAGYREALESLVSSDRVIVAVLGDPEAAPGSVVLVLTDWNTPDEVALAPWREAGEGRRLMVAACKPGVRVLGEERRWLVEDGDERFSVAAIHRARDRLGDDRRRGKRRPVYLAATTPAAGQAAWAAWLADPGAFAGVMLRGARFHAHYHADAIGALDGASGQRVVLGPSDDRAAGLLRDAGVHVTRIERGTDGVEAARLALDAWLD